MQKNRNAFVTVLKAKKKPTFEVTCDPQGKGCGKASLAHLTKITPIA